jgi:UPF0755 protein
MSWEPGPGPVAELERPAAQPRARTRRGCSLGLAFVLVAAVMVAAGAGLFFYGRHQLEPPAGDHSHSVTLTVRSGESVGDVNDQLAADGLIRSKFWFSLYERYRGLDNVQPGSYRLDSGMSASTIVGFLQVTPEARTAQLVFPEGLTARQMAVVVGKAGLGVTAQQYLDEVAKGRFTAPFLAHRPPGAGLEGFLFPDTYAVRVGATAHDVVQMQLDDFANKAAPLLAQIPASQTDYHVVTVASIVEREARFPEDRGLVASVIDNRLAAGMLLEVDATVTYGLGRSSGEPSAAEFQQDTPYNTYLHPGLPPTPISNPGVAAITAAAQPTPSAYLYYVSDGCGHNHYAVTAAEHAQNVRTYVGAPCAG